MTQEYFTIEFPERKRGKHLRPENCGAIQYRKELGLSNRAIAKQLICSLSTIGYELKRGRPNIQDAVENQSTVPKGKA